MTLRWKNGSPSYSCDDAGRCISTKAQATRPRPLPWATPIDVAPIKG